ncbi:MAG: transcriptional regulator [Deltaproteobacteria bacterium]|nr:transcriptional regulator [Deltaproteobacteria bacterium]
MSAQKIVKRYANRKLYDTERSCYVTLEDISQMIKAGEEVKVIDNKTGEDLTSVTLAQIIFETEKKKSFMPLTLLRDLIQNSGESISEIARDGAQRVQNAAIEIRDTAQKLKSDIEGRIERFTHRRQENESSAQSKLGELKKSFDEIQKNVEERIKGSVGTVSRYANLGRDMDEIRQRLEALEERLSDKQ